MMFHKIAKHRANDASNDVHRPPLLPEVGTAAVAVQEETVHTGGGSE